MLDIDIAYPEFVPNQILTDKQLNQLRTHLEQEDRATRLRLAGMGIVCGFVARRVTSPATGVEISGGYGLTSDGDLIEQCETTVYTGYRDYNDPDKDEEGKFRYIPWQVPSAPRTQRDIKELIPKADMDVDPDDRPAQARTLTSATLDTLIANRVLVLYLEHEPEELKSCLVTSCDNKGRNINVHVRALLVKKTDLAALTLFGPDPMVVSVPRLHTTGVLHGGVTAAQLNQGFRDIVTASVGVVGPTVKTLFDAHASFLNVDTLAAANPFATLLSNPAHVAQYQYDALRDYVSAYHEAAAAAYGLIEQCCPDGAFPRHLMLGVLDGSAPAGWRNEFQPAAMRNVMDGEFTRVRDLFRRLAAMIADLHLGSLPGTALIRPSHAPAYPLGRRARPSYFSGTTVEGLWRPRRRGTFDADWPWTNPSTSTLANDYADQTFLRIEGHVGRPWNTASLDLVTARHAGNAEFNVLCSFLDAGTSDEDAARDTWWNAAAAEGEIVDGALELFATWVVTGGEPDVSGITRLAKARNEQLGTVALRSQEWVRLRSRRRMHCDPVALAQDYLQARAELLCAVRRASGIVRRFRIDIGRLADDQLTAPGREVMLIGGQLVLARALVASVLVDPRGWASEEQAKARIEQLDPARGIPATRSALIVEADALAKALELIGDADVVLPREIEAFDYEMLAYVFRLAAAQSLELWHWTQAMGVRIPGTRYEFDDGTDLPLDQAESATIAGNWLGLHGCLLARFAAIAAQYESIRASDLTLFGNLTNVDGLEHLAGVSKGGTFVLVCDKPGTDGRVVADFSLEGCLPCCCDIDPNQCIPPLAMPDVRVITFPGGVGFGLGKANFDSRRLGVFDATTGFNTGFGTGFTGEAFPIDIDVLANDGDLRDPKTPLKVTLRADQSQLGNPIKALDNNLIEYAVRRPWPGVVDRFDYVVEQTDSCRGKAIGTVIVVYAVETISVAGIRGIVLAGGGPAEGATVTIDGTNMSVTTGHDGRFEFMRIPPGPYTLSATGQGTTDTVDVTVTAGDVSEDIVLIVTKPDTGSPPKGQIAVRVIDQTGAVIPGVFVRVVKEGDQPRQLTTDASGIAVVRTLPAGTYNITVLMAGAINGSATAQLADGASILVTVQMKPQTFEINTNTIRVVAEGTNTRVLDAAATVREAMNDRYARYVETFNAASDNPVITSSDPYKEAATFLAERVTDPAVPDATVTAEYQATATRLTESAKAATGRDKEAYQQALTAMTAAYFDRVAASNPAALSVDNATDLNAAVNTLKSAGVTTDAFKTVWKAPALETSAGIRSGAAIAKVVR